ncbi:MAG: acetylglutamate kinase [Bacillota bacterium]|jgi:acetylglutamate kinase
MTEITPLQKAEILVEALPYIKKFHGKTVVVKYGGNAMVNEELKQAVISDIVLMQLVGMRPVLVHGGGPDINKMLNKLNIESSFINGLRYTDADTIDVVEMVLVGKVNSSIVSEINQAGGSAVGLSGKDADLLKAHKKTTLKKDTEGKEEVCDLGYVGEIDTVNVDLINYLLDKGYIPVISPVAIGPDGESFNVNADIAAGKVAAALNAEKMVLLTDVEGLYANYEDKTTLISRLEVDDVDDLVEKGVIAGGMLPKIFCCVDSLKNGVNRTHILDGRVQHSILLEIFTNKGIGTMVYKK